MASPEIGDSHQRAIINGLARRMFRQKRNPNTIKAEIAKVIAIYNVKIVY